MHSIQIKIEPFALNHFMNMIIFLEHDVKIYHLIFRQIIK